MKKNNEILLVSDSRDELENIQSLLRFEFGILLQTNTEKQAISMFKQYHPSLLILAFEHVNDAERFYLSLYQHDENIATAPHKTLILCRGQESKLAYELCANGIMDDYVADRPMFDPYRLRLSVSQAIKSHGSDRSSYWLAKQLDKAVKDLKKMQSFIQVKLISGGNVHQNTIDIFNSFSSKLANDLKALESNVSPLFSKSNNDNTGSEAVGGFFNQFYDQTISSGTHKVVEQIKDEGHWHKEIAKETKVQLDSALEEHNKEKPLEVMLVDDDDMYREIMTSMLGGENIHVLGISDGRAAIRQLDSYKPDVILLDYNMPGLDGITVLTHIKTVPDFKNIPVIMLTGDSSREVVSGSKRAGADEYLIKPSDRKTILSKIDKVVQ